MIFIYKSNFPKKKSIIDCQDYPLTVKIWITLTKEEASIQNELKIH